MKIFNKSQRNQINLKLTDSENKKAVARINRIIGQLNSVKKDLTENHACEESITQLQAARGAISSLTKDLIDQGILNCISDYPKDKINSIIKSILSFK